MLHLSLTSTSVTSLSQSVHWLHVLRLLRFLLMHSDQILCGFETKEACEQAYFKMDIALIDDRRIHVGFSQSVAKLLSQYRRKDNQPGRGCFKCGSPDHMARDCTGDPANKHHPLKNILKDDDMQHGGGNNSRYEMVFDGDTPESPRPEKRGTGRVTEIGDMERTNDFLKIKEVNILRSDLIEKSIWIEEKNEEMEEETMEITERKIQIVKEGGDDHKDDQDYRKRSSDSHRDHDSHKKRDERDHRHRSAESDNDRECHRDRSNRDDKSSRALR
ncbi:hypothetical protein Peur_029460 [Populus x canadensis]|uniref:peptidyl-prolyl cis-trans isomerase CYP59-like isoform X4 n=1 Tax=Populus nigra TaxID=3691 RepID=UPI002B27AB4B|nr:peptidyl-prolyl cis-trans isomerase CYP59-like isoform X4 [Populus nigra]